VSVQSEYGAPPAPCSWPVIACGCELDEESGVDPNPQIQQAIEYASYVLWALSGRQFGCCSLTFRPCVPPGLLGADSPWGARLVDGRWINLPCRSCSSGCGCANLCEVRLPLRPVCSVAEVVADGVVLGEADWRIEGGSWLVLSEGVPCFPREQDLSLPLGEPGTWGITYSYGTEPPVAGQRAAGALACEIIKACDPEAGSCLPKRTQTIVRQGISAVLIDPMEFFDRQRTGIYEVDLFLAAANPHGRSRAARVASPDAPFPDRQVSW
jgi:hypothetical protein